MRGAARLGALFALAGAGCAEVVCDDPVVGLALEVGATDEDGDGIVDEMELRQFVAKHKKEGTLRKDIDSRVSSLMEKYDPQGNGTLSMHLLSSSVITKPPCGQRSTSRRFSNNCSTPNCHNCR